MILSSVRKIKAITMEKYNAKNQGPETPENKLERGMTRFPSDGGDDG